MRPMVTYGRTQMGAVATRTFSGFRPEAIQFLAELATHNERTWFLPRKAEYERLLKEPLAALCADLAVLFAERGIPLQADPVRSPFRIYRDVRFARDKSPYKTNIAASFPWHEATDQHRTEPRRDGHSPGGYFHLAPGDVFVGGGMRHPEPDVIGAFRRAIVERRDEVHAALDDRRFVEVFEHLSGDELRRVPSGFAPDDPDGHLLRLKDVIFGRRLSDAEALSPKLPALIADTLAAGVPVFRLLASLVPVARS